MYWQPEKKLVKQQYILHMSSQYGELWPTDGWDLLESLGHPSTFQRFRVLAALLHGTVVVGVSQTLHIEQRAPPIFGRAAITLALAHYPMVKTASLYDNFCKTGNYVISDVIIWVKLQKMARENFSIGAFYNITKNQDNPIKTEGQDSFLSPNNPKNTSF